MMQCNESGHLDRYTNVIHRVCDDFGASLIRWLRYTANDLYMTAYNPLDKCVLDYVGEITHEING